MNDAPRQRARSGGEAEASQPNGRARFVLPVLALLSALFFAGALAYAVGGGFLGGGRQDGAGTADRSKRGLPRDWANLIPLQPVDPDLKPRSALAGATEDSGPRPPDGVNAPDGPAAGPDPTSAPVATAAPRATPVALGALPRRVSLPRVTSRRLPALVDLTPSRPSAPGLPDIGGSVPDIDVLPGGVDIPPILPGGVQIPPILPGGVEIPPIDPLPGVPVVPPVDPLPGGGGGLPLPGGGGGLPLPGSLPTPGGIALVEAGPGLVAARRVAPLLPLASVAPRSVSGAFAPSHGPSARDAGEGARRERRQEDRAEAAEAPSAAAKRRAARPRDRTGAASVKKAPLVPDRRARGDRPRRDRAVPGEQEDRDGVQDCERGRDGAPPASAASGCDEPASDAGESSERQPRRKAPEPRPRDRAARAEGEAGP